MRRFRYGLARRILAPNAIELDFDCDFYGYQYRGNLSKNIDWTVFFLGAYESEILALLEIAVRSQTMRRSTTPVLLDIGANVGHHAMFLAQLGTIVHAFEPYKPYFDQLAEHIAINKIENLVAHNVGLGRTAQTLGYWPDKSPNRTGKFVFVAGHNRPEDEVVLHVVTGDRYLRERGVTDVAVVKLDTDGFEGAVLEGLQNTLRNDRPILVSELSHETRLQIASEERLRELLYPNAAIFSVDSDLRRRLPRLTAFAFAKTSEFIAVPRERLSDFERCYQKMTDQGLPK